MRRTTMILGRIIFMEEIPNGKWSTYNNAGCAMPEWSATEYIAR